LSSSFSIACTPDDSDVRRTELSRRSGDDKCAKVSGWGSIKKGLITQCFR
jgi:hypothetical protein